MSIIGKTVADVRDTMVELGESSILKISPPWFKPEYRASVRRLEWPNGCTATLYSGDQPDQLRGPQHDSAWVDELAKFRYPDDTWSNLMLGLRIGPNPQACVTTTPRPIPLIRKLLATASTRDIRCSTYDNWMNLSQAYIREVIDPLKGTRLGRQEIDGELLDDTPGALWNRRMIEELRRRHIPELVRIVVAIDPAETSGEDSCETGDVVAGLGADGHGYVLEDLTQPQLKPDAWAKRAIYSGYYAFHADRIVAETNAGGEMVEHTLRTVDPHVPYKGVHAKVGKYLRAEPVAALYEQGKVHHVGCFPELEDQMCTWVQGEKSPDRLDALVHALTDLMITGRRVVDIKTS